MIDYTGSVYRGKSFLLPLFWDRDLNLNVFGLIFDSKYNKERSLVTLWLWSLYS